MKTAGLIALLTAGIAIAADSEPMTTWVRSHAIALKTVEPGRGFDDMQSLRKVVGDARIVALGEATHGTREFFQLKHRMVEFLATEMGFNVFAIEANMPETYRMNDYVLRGEGDPKEILKGMYFWTWDTEEVLDMVRWMREFNRSGRGHLEFTGFDMQTPTVAMEVVRSFVAQQDSGFREAMERAYSDVPRMNAANGTAAFGVATARFPLAAAAGKHVNFSGFIKTQGVTQGFAGLWWRVDGQPGSPPLAFDNMQYRGAVGTTPWTRYEISLDVPAGATNINFGVLHPGNGTAWFDSLEVLLNGETYRDNSLFDLDFESPAARGFYTAGNGYQVGIDSKVANSGGQSLRIQFLNAAAGPTQPRGVDPAQAVRSCTAVVRHLENLPPQSGLDWPIQNARLVLQYAQLKSGEKTRDQSMAENVEWIAGQSSRRKVIIWAHNGHVAYGGYPGLDSMGGYLRDAFGKAMLNFGFAFNEGSFRAVETGKGLREFTVAPAPEGSLDRTLAAAGIPVMAIDLRQAPKDGAVGDWLAGFHQTRSVGAVYSESNAAQALYEMQIRDRFDALLFVEKTSAARGNPR